MTMNYEELALAGVDVKELLDRFMNNTVLVRRIIEKFLSDTTYLQLKEAARAGDMKAAEFACHSLKGICGNLSLKKLFTMLQEQLRLFRAGDHTVAAGMTGVICDEYERAVEHLRLWITQQ